MTTGRRTWGSVDGTPCAILSLQWLICSDWTIPFFTLHSARVAVVVHGVQWPRIRSLRIGHVHILVLEVSELLQSSFQKLKFVQSSAGATFAKAQMPGTDWAVAL